MTADLLSDGMIKVAWVATIAVQATPTAAELIAGTDLTPLLTPDGLTTDAATAAVDLSSLASTTNSEGAGRRTWSIMVKFKRKVVGADDLAYTTLVYRASGFLVVRRNLATATAFVAAQKVDVFPVQVTAPSLKFGPNTVQTGEVQLLATDDASLNVAVT